jgi:hypothetical protein
MHVPTEDESYDTRDNFYKVLGFLSILYVSHGNFLRRFKCKYREGSYFKSRKRVCMKLLMIKGSE